jgi:6-phosphogluconolactonase
MARPTIVIGDPQTLRRAFADDFQLHLSDTVAARGRFLLAVSGGSIGPLFFPTLAAMQADWNRVEIFWVDERAVAPADPESNFSDADRLWLTPAQVAGSRIHRMAGESPNLAAAATSYGLELTRLAGSPPTLDYVLLGVGPDGHVASLFPGHSALSVETDLVVAVEDAPKPPPRRLTLTMPVLTGAKRVVAAATGEAKAQTIASALRDRSETPVAMLLNRTVSPLLLLDEAAASELPKQR